MINLNFNLKGTISKGKACNKSLQNKFIYKKAMKIYFKVYMEYQAGKRMILNFQIV